jgi:hypothetical protein
VRNVYAPHISESIRRHARELEISDLDTTGRIQQILTDTLRSDGTQGTHVWNWNFYPLYILLLLLFSIFTRPPGKCIIQQSEFCSTVGTSICRGKACAAWLFPTTQPTVRAHVPVAPSLASRPRPRPPHLAILASPQERIQYAERHQHPDRTAPTWRWRLPKLIGAPGTGSVDSNKRAPYNKAS